ncbi:MAG: CapA family protein [Proteobacteria bacterium]|nr:CapA family protein [Pseudomonadota bacterium]
MTLFPVRTTVIALALACAASAGHPADLAWPPADPQVIQPDALDPLRPPSGEDRTTVADGFTLALAGDLIIARPLTEAAPVPGFDELLSVVRSSDAAFGNLETTIIDIRHFSGAPYPYDGDWANIALPAVAPDLKKMGFSLLGRANNHALDWGLEGMRETSRRLEEAGIPYAGCGETAALARAPGYFESRKGRVALVSFATTFRPSTDARDPHGSAPGRAGLSAVHLALKVHVRAPAMAALAGADCQMNRRSCGAVPASLTLNGTTYVQDDRDFNEYAIDVADLESVGRSIREARQHADLVIVAVHAHECAWDCEHGFPMLPGEFLKSLAHGAIDAGADVFATTGIHNLGPMEVYHGRPVFYGFGDFFWSDIQEPVPGELFALNRALLEGTYAHPERATDYDLTAPLNAVSFRSPYPFQSVLAQLQFSRGRLASISLYPVNLGYGDSLRTSGTPRLERRPVEVARILGEIRERTAAYGLKPLEFRTVNGVAKLELP